MGKTISSLVGLLLLFTACGSDVEVGGPRDDAGGSAGTTTHENEPPIDDTSSGGQSDTATPQPETPVDPATFADGEAPCETDADCCVVTNDCSNTAYVVGLDDKEAATKAVAAERAGQEAIGHCTACIAPLVQVFCQNNKCAGSELDPRQGELDSRLAEDHCGSIGPVDAPTMSTDRSSYGCGAR